MGIKKEIYKIVMRRRWVNRGMSFLEFEANEQQFYIRNINAGDTIFDVGANVGELTLLFSKFASPSGRVHSFEPTPATFDKLNALVKTVGRSNVKTNQCVVADAAGVVPFHVYDDSHTTWNTMANRPLENYGIVIDPPKTIEVKSITLDDYCKENQIDRIDLLKIDVEGAELAVLKGARRMFEEKKIRICVFEFGQTIHDMGYKSDDIQDFFKSFEGYSLRNLFTGRQLFPVNTKSGQAEFAINIASLKGVQLR